MGGARTQVVDENCRPFYKRQHSFFLQFNVIRNLYYENRWFQFSFGILFSFINHTDDFAILITTLFGSS